MKPLKITGHSLNITFYAPDHPRPEGYVWCEVLRVATRVVSKEPARFHISVYRHGVGQIKETTYEPARKPPRGPLAERTVTRIVRELLARMEQPPC